MFFFEIVLAVGHYLSYHIWTVHFSEPLGYWIAYFVDVYMAAFYYLTLVVVFVFWAVFSALWQFYFKTSRKPEAVDVNVVRYQIIPFRLVTHNENLEFWWTVIPSAVVFFIALPALFLLYALETPFAAPALTMKAIGHQWYWAYEYTDKLSRDVFYQYADKEVVFDSYMVAEPDLEEGQRRLLQVDKPAVLPIETQLRIIVTAADVLHSWAIPSLGLKMDAIPGRLNQFYLYIPFQGVYYGQCSELCGANHGFMPISLYAVKPDVFVEWYLHNASLFKMYVFLLTHD